MELVDDHDVKSCLRDMRKVIFVFVFLFCLLAQILILEIITDCLLRSSQ